MKHVARAGLGAIAGLFALWGGTAIINNNYLVGIIAVIIGAGLFFYAWRG